MSYSSNIAICCIRARIQKVFGCEESKGGIRREQKRNIGDLIEEKQMRNKIKIFELKLLYK